MSEQDFLYPLKFKPIFKDKIWGGQKMRTVLCKDFTPLPNCGESWEISGIEDDVSIVENGFLAENDLNELIEIYMHDLVGEKVYDYYGLGFPLLIKIIDAAENLSVQVHPDDEYAYTHCESNGKTELWHVLDADPGAGLYVGFKTGVTKEQYITAVSDGNVDQLLEFYPVATGDTFFIPAGTVHAIGKGVLLAEIQQSSDITFRVFDWNRKDEEGNTRELHTQEALEVIDFNNKTTYKINPEIKQNSTVKLIRNEYFNINMIDFNKPLQKVFTSIDSFVIYICTEGEVHFIRDDKIEVLKRGETLLKPALIDMLNLVPVMPSKLLEVYIDIIEEEE
ncbi:class I mannose-6-phosphate isomerase [Bacteroidales bacterium OttesenSCG-928-C03]|nr:class I mannose-6-phosphate isomerase [Bacteroidales bacterium OttesenSCG-928-E04]MDL2309126.1 class I mannose-6-phosphate isomerase [Bacteroidales bacterium OttesenSCG-928-C03]MDL2325970.1 class I mannose-6-phosphate isomerase [Bacteroidales bacterium OttesenSCG-928-A14]